MWKIIWLISECPHSGFFDEQMDLLCPRHRLGRNNNAGKRSVSISEPSMFFSQNILYPIFIPAQQENESFLWALYRLAGLGKCSFLVLSLRGYHRMLTCIPFHRSKLMRIWYELYTVHSHDHIRIEHDDPTCISKFSKLKRQILCSRRNWRHGSQKIIFGCTESIFSSAEKYF